MKLMAPVTVHMCDEIYAQLGAKDSIHNQAWPEYDDNLAKMNSIQLVVQVNGKTRDLIETTAEATQDELKALAQKSPKAQQFIEGKEIVKIIVVPGRLVNIVVK